MGPVLLHSPAKIVSQALIDVAAGSSPDEDPLLPWPVYTDLEPDGVGVADEVITVYDTDGFDDGRSMIDGELYQHHGFQVRLRSKDHASGYVKAAAVRALMAEGVLKRPVSLDSINYLVWAVAKIGRVVRMGREQGKSRRHLFTINACAAIIRRLPTPAVYYPFDGDATDHGPNGLDLTESNVAYDTGKFAQAVVLDAALPADLTAASAAPIEFNAGDSFSISLWVRADSNGTHYLVSKAATGTTGTEVYLSLQKAGGMKPKFTFFGGEVNALSTITVGGWHHVVATYDAALNQMSIWLDGVQGQTTTPPNLIADEGTQLWVGRFFNGVTPFPLDGALDDLAIVPAVLSPADITGLYDGGSGRPYVWY